MKKQSPMLDLLPFLDDQGQNDLLAIIDHYVEKANMNSPSNLYRINRLTKWRYKIITQRTS